MSFARFRFLTAIAALVVLTVACGVEETGVARSTADAVQDVSDISQARPETTRSLEDLLALIPDTEISRQHVLIDDLAARREILDIQAPGPDALQEDFDKYSGRLYMFPGNRHLVPITRDYGQLITGFPENVGSDQAIGFDLRNVDQSIHIRGDRFRRYELVLGRFNPELTDELIATCNNCVPVEQLSHEDTGYYSWAVGARNGDFRLAPPITDHSGEGGFFRFTDSMAVRSLHQIDMEKFIERSVGKTPSLLDDKDYALAASLLQGNRNVDAIFSGQTLSVGNALKDLKQAIEYQGEHFKIADDLEGTLGTPTLLLPYRLHASAARFENDQFVVTNVLIHDDEEAAQANAARLKERIENGIDLRGAPWTDMLDSYDITVSGRAVIAEFMSSDPDVTLLRIFPTDSPSSVIILYSALFTHEDVPESASGSSTGRFPTPTPVHTTSLPPAPGSQVGEQEPACLDRGGGGSYRDGFNRIYWFMDPPGPGTTAEQAVAQHICLRGGSWVPDGRIIIRQADFLWADLRAWQGFPVIWSVNGVYSSGVDVTQNRLVVRVSTPYAAEQLAKNIEASEVPRDAVIIEVNKQIGLDDPPAKPFGEIGIEISIEFDPAVRLGEDVEFSIVLTNTTDRTLEIEHGTPPEVDIVVLTPEGRQVWRHLGPILAGRGGSTKIRPDSAVRFSVTWSQMDHDGFAIQPGEYLVRGFARFSNNDTSLVVIDKLSTAPLRITVVEN